MNLQYLNWKIFLENPAEAEPEEYFKVFNTWLPDSPEVFLDVADYKHVSDGPVMVLVGHYLNISLDGNGRRLGLLLDYKQPMDGGNADKLLATLRDLLLAARRLEGEAKFSHKPAFKTAELQLIVNSRAVAPNTPETFAAVKPDLSKVLAKAYGDNAFTLEHLADPRQRFSVRVTAKGNPDSAEMLKRLS
jgi:hypothetical protein